MKVGYFLKMIKAIKVFASYDKDSNSNEITFGDRTMIPTSWVVKMTKIE